MIHELQNPIKIVTPLGDAIAIMVESGGTFSDDCWTCAMLEDGQIRHFLSSQLKVWHNGTFGINMELATKKKDEENK